MALFNEVMSLLNGKPPPWKPHPPQYGLIYRNFFSYVSNVWVKYWYFYFHIWLWSSGLSGAGNLLNALLSPILIFTFGFGVSGAAIAGVISEYVVGGKPNRSYSIHDITSCPFSLSYFFVWSTFLPDTWQLLSFCGN